MLFNSYVFLGVFLPCTWLLYFGCNKIRRYEVAKALLLLASLVFYGYENPYLCLLILSSVFVNYFLHRILSAQGYPLGGRTFLLTAGILFNLGLLVFFKYTNFLIDNINRLSGLEIPFKNIILPLGISFYTFQQISFLVDTYKRDCERYPLLDYALFVTFFPQLVAGPIVLHKEMIPQFQDISKKKINPEYILQGLEFLAIGFAKKVLVADVFAQICDAGYLHLAELHSLGVVVTILAFTLQIFFDFSGYCDMAIGLGKLFNIDIPDNFCSPYKSLNISEFWKRWHMTLTRFLTTYIYIPLGGNRKGKLRMYLNVMIVFLISGFWHGAAWNYVMWGLLHGALMVAYRIGNGVWDKLPKWLAWTLNFAFINLAWVFFRADYPSQPFFLFQRLCSGGGMFVLPALEQAFSAGTLWNMVLNNLVPNAFIPTVWTDIFTHIVFFGWFCLWICVCIFAPNTRVIVDKPRKASLFYVLLGVLFAWGIMTLSGVSKFIYFNF